MKFEIQLDGQDTPVTVTLENNPGNPVSAAIQNNQPFRVRVDNRAYTATWQKPSRTLLLSAEQAPQNHPHSAIGLEIPVGVRTLKTERFDGEAESHCEFEIVVPQKSGASLAKKFKATALKLLPGSESAARGAAKMRRPGPKNPILRSQITGKVISIVVTPGAIVEQGEPLLVIEAMKMENRILAPSRVKISAIKVEAGRTVSAGDELVHMESADQDPA